MTGAVQSVCFASQPKWDITIALLIALVSSVVAVVVNAIFAPAFAILNVENTKDREDRDDVPTKEHVRKVAPSSVDNLDEG